MDSPPFEDWLHVHGTSPAALGRQATLEFVMLGPIAVVVANFLKRHAAAIWSETKEFISNYESLCEEPCNPAEARADCLRSRAATGGR
jgi:hypothetical protein